jgi:hypothetical protein
LVLSTAKPNATAAKTTGAVAPDRRVMIRLQGYQRRPLGFAVLGTNLRLRF